MPPCLARISAVAAVPAGRAVREADLTGRADSSAVDLVAVLLAAPVVGIRLRMDLVVLAVVPAVLVDRAAGRVDNAVQVGPVDSVVLAGSALLPHPLRPNKWD